MEDRAGIWIAVIAVVGVFALVGGLMWTLPNYRLWSREMRGRSALAEAEWDRQIAVQEAEAEKLSAEQLAEAEIIRARGVAEANAIIGESLRNNESYLRYLWIQGLHDGSSEVIYIPTEANLPILEAAGR